MLLSEVEMLIYRPQTREESSGNTIYEGAEFTSFDLQDFSIYRPPRDSREGRVWNKLSGEFAGLQDLCVKKGNHSILYFDGIITDGLTQHYVQDVAFETLSIGGYEDLSTHTAYPDTWIQSFVGAQERSGGVWYRLKSSSNEYSSFHRPFMWLADLAKHFVDYLANHEDVYLQAFRADFFAWLCMSHGDHKAFNEWAEAYGDVDFRRAIIAHSGFLSNQASHICISYMSHPLWKEVHFSTGDLSALKAHPRQEQRTIVTPLVYHCFKDMAFGKFLKIQHPNPSTTMPRWPQSINRPISAFSSRNSFQGSQGTPGIQPNIRVGDVVKLNRDQSKDSKWKDAEEFWYAYVQRIETTKYGAGLRVIWLDSPSHTTCSTMHYPKTNELFLSDHCNCNERRPIPVEEALSTVAVTFFSATPAANADFFVRQQFSRCDSSFTSLKKVHFTCACSRSGRRKDYKAGSTVLIRGATSWRSPVLEVVELLAAVKQGFLTVKVRRLPRRGKDFDGKDAPPNELVYTSNVEDLPVKCIQRPCHVRFFSVQERDNGAIPAPYCRQGTGDAYYIVYKEAETAHSLQAMCKPYPRTLNQGFHPCHEQILPRLKCMDLFCGGGNFGRGLEEGGALEMRWAIDIDTHAMHTYRANLRDPARVGLFLGSAIDYLSRAMNGFCNDVVAQPGEVEAIAAGAPCVGFSKLNQHRADDKSLRNNSLIALFAAYVDFYRPKYAILENVPDVSECAPKKKNQNVFSQMICAFVAMGYQVQQFHLDAWNFGSPQRRSRLFISLAAPGLTPMSPPPESHSHPPGVKNRALGKAANGLSFGERNLDIITPFPYRTIGQATSDLPENFHGRITSIRYPDHQVPRHEVLETYMRITCIPRYPPFSSLTTARKQNLIPRALVDSYRAFFDNPYKTQPGSRAYQRINADALCPTITTTCAPSDVMTGPGLHWIGDRCLTVLEARRAQGYPDSDVIVGTPAHQWRIIGNSVPRTLALALGLSLREAWLANAPMM